MINQKANLNYYLVNYQVNRMNNEIYRAVKSIDPNKLTPEDKFELLEIFKITRNDLVRNQIAILLADAGFKEAVPEILKKIGEKGMISKNGTLVFTVGGLISQKNIVQIVRIICEQEYEARLMAFEIIKNLRPSLTPKSIKNALTVLASYKKDLHAKNHPFAENSTLHFIEETIAILEDDPILKLE